MQSRQSIKKCKSVVALLILLPAGASWAAGARTSDPLPLEEAERLARELDPVASAYAARSEAYNELAVADGQLPDPRMKLGVMNLPADSFDRGDEPMTQLQLGLTQAIPPGRTLQYRQERTEALADREAVRGQERALAVTREVRIRYLELFYQTQAGKRLQQNRALFDELLAITQRQYAAGRDNQHDVLRAQLELSLMDDRILDVIRAREAAAGELARFLTGAHSNRPIPDDFPALVTMPPGEQIRAGLVNHPLVRIEDAAILASKKKISEVEQQYKPGFNIDLTYGNRSSQMPDGTGTPDMLSAMVMVDLPLFTGKRQDRRLAAAIRESSANQFVRTDRLLELSSILDRELANWQRFSDRLDLYRQRAIADARQNAESTLRAYQSDSADFTTLMRAQLLELNTQLDMLKIRVNRAKVQAQLLYLAGGR